MTILLTEVRTPSSQGSNTHNVWGKRFLVVVAAEDPGAKMRINLPSVGSESYLPVDEWPMNS